MPRDAALSLERSRDGEAVLDRLHRALAGVERHWMRRVAEQRRPPLAPTLHGHAVVHVRCVTLRPASTRSEPRWAPPTRWKRSRHDLFGSSISVPSGSLAIATQQIVGLRRGETRTGAAADVERNSPYGALVLKLDIALPDGVARIARLRAAEELPTHGRAETVGADEHVAALFAPLNETRRHVVGVLDEARKRAAERERGVLSRPDATARCSSPRLTPSVQPPARRSSRRRGSPRAPSACASSAELHPRDLRSVRAAADDVRIDRPEDVRTVRPDVDPGPTCTC